MTTTEGLITATVDVPGARLRYEVRGQGPLLFVIGSPMAAADFAPLAHAMAVDHTVVTYDPRGLAGSTVEDPDQDATPDLRADDVAAIMNALGAESADVLGSSGGAVTGLALVTRHPGRVRTLVAHEPPLLELLPDAEQHRAATDEIIAAFHRDGPGAAWAAFMVHAGYDLDDPKAGPPPGPRPDRRRAGQATRRLGAVLRPRTTSYHPVPARRGRVDGQRHAGDRRSRRSNPVGC